MHLEVATTSVGSTRTERGDGASLLPASGPRYGAARRHVLRRAGGDARELDKRTVEPGYAVSGGSVASSRCLVDCCLIEPQLTRPAAGRVRVTRTNTLKWLSEDQPTGFLSRLARLASDPRRYYPP